MGLAAVGRLVDQLAEPAEADPAATATAMDEWVQRSLLPYFRESAVWDRARAEQMRGELQGESGPVPSPCIETPQGPGLPTPAELGRAATLDLDIWRAMVRANMLMDDERAVGSPAVLDRVRRVLAEPTEPTAPKPPVGPDRRELEQLLAPYA
jgi:hypothetical protein